MHLSINTLPVYTLNSNNQLNFIPFLAPEREKTLSRIRESKHKQIQPPFQAINSVCTLQQKESNQTTHSKSNSNSYLEQGNASYGRAGGL